MYDEFYENAESFLPKLYIDQGIRESVLEDCNIDDSPLAIAAINNNRDWSELDCETIGELSEVILQAYHQISNNVISGGYDGNAPGMSGIFGIMEYGGLYSSHTDGEINGVYNSLQDACEHEALFCIASPEISSVVLSHVELVELTKKYAVPMDEDGFEVTINDRRYVVGNGDLKEMECPMS